MAETEIIVSSSIQIKRPAERPAVEALRAGEGLFVELDGGRAVRLAPEDPRSEGFAEILEGLKSLRAPVYLEVDPATRALKVLRIPLVSKVASVREGRGGELEIALATSSARHVLRADRPDFARLKEALTAAAASGAPMVVTEDDAHNILDVRGFTPSPEGPPLPFPEWEEPLLKWPPIPKPTPIPWFPWPKGCVSAARAQQVFDEMAATTCNPLTVPAPCIPFLYPDDGCWARAHEMCRLMIAKGLTPKKVWIQGSLHVSTKNNPNCQVFWGWHVAPTLRVRGKWFFTCSTMVIDPSLFSTPVTEAVWKSVQGDPNATLTASDASDYLWGQTDPDYSKTNDRLAYYRLQLKARALQHGPPPYANCA